MQRTKTIYGFSPFDAEEMRTQRRWQDQGQCHKRWNIIVTTSHYLRDNLPDDRGLIRGRLAQPRESNRLQQPINWLIFMKLLQMMLKTVQRWCTDCVIAKSIPDVNDSFAEEVLSQFSSCSFLCEFQRMTTGPFIYWKFKKCVKLNSTGHVTLMAKRDQKKGKKATAYQYPLSLI